MRDIQQATPAEVQLWRKRIERREDSLLTRSEYAAEIGVDEVTWRRWERYVTGRVLSVRVIRRRELPAVICNNPRCGEVFAPVREEQRYCCEKCRATARWIRQSSRAQAGVRT